MVGVQWQIRCGAPDARDYATVIWQEHRLGVFVMASPRTEGNGLKRHAVPPVPPPGPRGAGARARQGVYRRADCVRRNKVAHTDTTEGLPRAIRGRAVTRRLRRRRAHRVIRRPVLAHTHARAFRDGSSGDAAPSLASLLCVPDGATVHTKINVINKLVTCSASTLWRPFYTV